LIVTADEGEDNIQAWKPGKKEGGLVDEHNRLLIPIRRDRVKILQEALRKSRCFFPEAYHGGGWFLDGNSTRFTHDVPRRGDVLVIVRRGNGKIKGVTAPVISVGACG
jgi:hypothetical protein